MKVGKMKFRRLAGFLCFVMVVLSFAVPAAAEEAAADTDVQATEAAADPEVLSAEDAQDLIQAVAMQLGIYARYEDISERSLYKTAVERLVEENPDLYHEVLKAMLESVDEHSEYYTAEEAEKLMQTVNGEVNGIGVSIDFTNPEAARIVSVIPDTPADKAGIQVGDLLVGADGVDLRGMQSESILSLIRGAVGTTVHIDVERNGAVMGFDIVRDAIIGTSVTSKIFEDSGEKLMYIRVYGFVKNTAEKFEEALKEADLAGIENLIIDVRDNGGGILGQAVEMANNFVPKDSIITTEDHKNEIFNKVYKGTKVVKSKYNTVVLINENSASASEVFAAALHENGAATLIGTRSYGKGTIQSINGLQTGGMIKYTSGFYLTPSGNNINGVGLVPDAYVENQLEPINEEEFGSFEYTRTYQVGDTGEEVRLAKEILKLFNIYQGEMNDVFDQDLYYAVYAFQTQAQIFPYGVLDLTTQLQLHNFLSKAKIEIDDQLKAGFAHFGMTMPSEEAAQ